VRTCIMKILMKKLQTNLKSTLWRYYAFTFLRGFALFSAVLVPMLTQWADLSMVKVQFLQSWFMFWVFVLEIPTGAIADKVGRKYSLALGAAIGTIAALVYGSIPHFSVFLLGEFLFAISLSLISGAGEALLFDSLKEQGRENESTSMFGKAHAVGLAALLFSAPLGSVLADSFDLNAPMLFTAIPSLLAALVIWGVEEPSVHSEKSESKRYLDIVKEGSLYFLKHEKLRRLAIDAIGVSAAAYFVIWLYQPILLQLGVNVSLFGLVHAGLVGVQIVIANNFEALSKLVGSKRKFIQLAALLTAIGFVVAALHQSYLTLFLFLVLAGGFGLTRMKLMLAYMHRFIPSDKRSTVGSSISMFQRFALVVLNPIVGILADWSLSVALFAVGLLAFSVFGWSVVRDRSWKVSS